MKRTNLHAIVAVVVGLCVSSGVLAQELRQAIPASEKFVISARAGGVNYVEGAVTIIRTSGKSGILLKRDQVEVGDRVTNGPDGRAEVLLNPGSFIRLGKNSSFEFGTTDLEDLQIRLDSGSAIFEVFASDEFRVSVLTPKGKVALVDTGLYRVDISTDGTALVAVSKGKATVGEASETIVKGGRTGTVGTDTVAVAKFDKDKRDDLAEWSKSRSKELTRINSNLNARLLSGSLLNGFRSGRLSMYDSFGLWIFDAPFGGFCFLPFGNGWRSPYGFWYNNGIYPNYYPGSYVPPVRQIGPSSGVFVDRVKVRNPTDIDTNPGVKTGSRTQADSDPGIKTGSRRNSESYEPPPFAKVGRGSDIGNFGSGGRVNGGSDFPADRSSPSVSFPSNSSPNSREPAAPAAAPVPAVKGQRDNN